MVRKRVEGDGQIVNDDLDITGGPSGLFDIGAEAHEPEQPPAEPAKPDPWDAVHELKNQVSSLVDVVGKLAARDTQPKALAGVQDAPAQPGQGNPVLAEFQAQMASGLLKTEADAAAFWDQKAISQPGWTAMAQIALSRMVATETANTANRGNRSYQAESALDQFYRDHANDPMFRAVREDFEELIEKERSMGSFERLTPQQIAEGIPRVYETAVGRAALKRAQGSSAEERQGRANRPPLYPVGSGSSGGFGGERGAGTGKTSLTPQNEIERQLVASGQEYGLSKEEIADSLRQLREDAS
jgi:hypothetical protein